MSGEATSVRDALTDAMRYWEPKRLIFNIVLATIVAAQFGLLGSGPYSLADTLIALFLLAVLANVAYCAAYVADIPAQLSGYRPQWIKFRLILFLIGLVFSAGLTLFLSRSLFGPDI